MYTDYVQAGKELSAKLAADGYNILKTEDAVIANADWYDMGFDKPPVAENTIAYTVEAGNYSYSRVYLEGYNNPMSTFIVRTDEIGGWLMRKSDIEGLTPAQITDLYALPKVPTHICDVTVDSDAMLQTGIVNPV